MSVAEPAVGPRPTAPVGVYLHFPWCVHKCPYCDFNSHALRGALPEAAYLRVLLADLTAELERCAPRPVATVFMGGGTPSLFSAGAVAEVFERLGAVAALEADLEVTLEANPGTLEAGRFAAYRAAGVNRLSIGVQSFDDRCLHALGRIHDGSAAESAFASARQAGFDNINLDLMYGLPGQDAEAALADLEHAIALAPEHLSWYELTLEPNTAFHRSPPALPDADRVAQMAALGRARLAAAGYERYEVSAYARAGRRCRHNLNYWRHGDYLGVGAGAHGKLMDATGVVRRSIKQRHPRSYVAATDQQARLLELRAVRAEDALFEALLNGLRLVEGIALDTLAASAGLSRAALLERVAAARARGLLEVESERLRATVRGYDFLDSILQDFLPS